MSLFVLSISFGLPPLLMLVIWCSRRDLTLHTCAVTTSNTLTRNPEASVTQRFILLRPYSLIYFHGIEIPPRIAMTPSLLSGMLFDGCHALFPGRFLVPAPSRGPFIVLITADKQRSEALGLRGCVYNTLFVKHRRRVGFGRIIPRWHFVKDLRFRRDLDDSFRLQCRRSPGCRLCPTS